VFLTGHVLVPSTVLALSTGCDEAEGSLYPSEIEDEDGQANAEEASMSLLQLKIAYGESSQNRSAVDETLANLAVVSVHNSTAANLASVSVHNPIWDIWDVISSVWDAVTGLTDNSTSIVEKVLSVGGAIIQIANASTTIAELATDIKTLVTDVELGGNDRQYINFVLVLLIGVLAIILVTVDSMERWYPEIWTPSKNGPSLLVLTMLVLSYLLLIPSLFSTLFSFLVEIDLVGMHLVLTSDPPGTPNSVTESYIGVIGLLHDTGSMTGAVLVILYAIIIPGLKVIFLACGEYMRGSSNPDNVKRARQCILFVQAISKWACPDMFAMILLLYLFRNLPAVGGLLETKSQLDIGFAGFSIFCMLSTFSSLLIEPPKELPSDATASNVSFKAFGPNTIFGVTAVLLAIFSVLLGYGLTSPCMALAITEDSLIEPNGPVPASWGFILKALDVSSLVNDNVTVWNCMWAMASYAWTLREANCVLAFIMLAIFAVGLPCANMLLLAVAAGKLSSDGPNTAMQWARVLGKFSMLDVMCMGVVVIVFAAGMYEDVGVAFSLQYGIWVMVGAEVVHYITYWIVDGAVRDAEEQIVATVKDG